MLFFIMKIAMADNAIITHKYTADPNAIVYKDRVYVYCSHDDNNPDDGFNIIDYTLVSSDDMKNWTDHGEVFKVPRDGQWARQAYAPGAVVKGDKVYLYIPDGGSQVGVAIADRPEGPFKDPLGKALITKSMPNCNVEWLFDPAAFIDDDGQAYLYFGGGGSTPGVNLRVIKLNDDMISTNGTAVTIKAPRSFEASYMHKYKGTYFFSYSNDFAQSPSAQIAYMTGKNPMGPFEHKGAVLDNPALNGKNINNGNNNHASIVEFEGKWYIFYHDRRVSGQTYKRSVSVDLVTYNADGTLMNKTTVTEGVAQIKYLNPYDTVQAETINRQSGIKTDVCSEGGMMVTSISANDYIRIRGVDFGEGAKAFEVRASSNSQGGSIELHLGSENGTLVGTCEIKGTGGWDKWETFTCDISGCEGVNDLYLVFKGSNEPFRLNWYKFSGTPSVQGFSVDVEVTGDGTVATIPNQSSFPEGTEVVLVANPGKRSVFKGWSGEDISSDKDSLKITVKADVKVSAVFERSMLPVVLNGDFSSETDEWTLNVWSGKASGSVVDGEYKIAIDSVSDVSHEIQLIQAGIYLEKGKSYKVSFDAYAESERTMEANVEMTVDPWTGYTQGVSPFQITTKKKTYSFEFDMEEPTDTNGRLSFNTGSFVSDVFIDNIKIEQLPPNAVLVSPVKNLSAVKMVCSNSSLRIEFAAQMQNSPVSIKMYNLNGKLVKSEILQKISNGLNSHQMNLSQLSNGSYIVKVMSQKGIVHSSKILLTK